MDTKTIEILKNSGQKVKFSLSKLRRSLKKSDANNETVNYIVNLVKNELYQGISSREIYNRAFALLKKEKGHFASKYKLKKAIYELGPTGFPFEKFIAAVLKHEGYTIQVSEILQGKCIQHEIDVVATKNNLTSIIECKFHSEQGLNCNVKIPLYINSRYKDVKDYWGLNKSQNSDLEKGWVVTNTRFTQDALKYGTCAGLYLLSWDHPKGKGLKDRIDKMSLYPITVSTLLTEQEKQHLLNRGLVLCIELLKKSFYLDHLGVSDIRKEKIINEIQKLCQYQKMKSR